jgi:hypothetical protein
LALLRVVLFFVLVDKVECFSITWDCLHFFISSQKGLSKISPYVLGYTDIYWHILVFPIISHLHWLYLILTGSATNRRISVSSDSSQNNSSSVICRSALQLLLFHGSRLVSMIFESASRLQWRQDSAFWLKRLRTIQFPSSVEVLCQSCSDRQRIKAIDSSGGELREKSWMSWSPDCEINYLKRKACISRQSLSWKADRTEIGEFTRSL